MFSNLENRAWLRFGDRRILSADDARTLAERRLPRLVFDFIDGAAETELTPVRNRAALDDVLLQPRVLKNVRNRRLSTRVLGSEFSVPFGVAPMGMCGLATVGADQILGTASRDRNMPICLSAAASMSIEEMRRIAGVNAWFQLYVTPSEEQTLGLVDRARAAGYETLVLTADVPQVARRRRDVRNGFEMPFRMRWRQFLDFALHPGWSLPMLMNGRPSPANFDQTGGNKFDRHGSRAGADWAFLERLRELWQGNLIVKGVTSVSDAKRIQRIGADGVWVSNHGGRQLGSAPASASVLPAIRAIVGPDYPLIFDSGVRSGEDVVRALALGADFVMLGRPLLYALGAAGSTGLNNLLVEITSEIDTVMAQIGVCEIAEINAGNLVASTETIDPELPTGREAVNSIESLRG